MTREEAKEVFLNRGFIDGIYDGNKWREACIVISKWLEQEPTTKNDLGVDIDKLIADCEKMSFDFELFGRPTKAILLDAVKNIVKALPSVTPQEPKTGHWIKTPKAVMGEGYMWYCDKCEHQVYQDSSRDYPSEKYCPNCGCAMVESQER